MTTKWMTSLESIRQHCSACLIERLIAVTVHGQIANGWRINIQETAVNCLPLISSNKSDKHAGVLRHGDPFRLKVVDISEMAVAAIMLIRRTNEQRKIPRTP